MFLPLSDAPNPRGVPVITYTLIAINVAVHLLISWPLTRQAPDLRDPALQEYAITVRETLPPEVPLQAALREVSAYDLFVFKHGFRPAAPDWMDLLTSVFLHGGFLHLFGNMLFLWIYGDNVEHRLGRFRYLVCYLLTGVAATLFYTLFAPNSKLPLVGASGAISGVLGFYFLWFPRNVVRVFVFLFPFLMNVIEIPARIVLGIYLLIDNLLPFVFTRGSEGGGVAHGAHIGGFLAGLALAWAMDRRELSAAPEEYRRSRSTPPPLPGTTRSRIIDVESQIVAEDATPRDPAQFITAAIGRGDLQAAAEAYFALDAGQTRRLLRPRDSLALADWLAQHGHAQAALTVCRRHLRDYPTGPGAAEAHLGAGLVQLDVLGQAAPAYQHFLEALALDPSAETEQRARAALGRIADLQKYPFRRFAG